MATSEHKDSLAAQHPYSTTTAALYVAELLDQPDLGEFERHSGECLVCRQEIEYWRRATEAFEAIRHFFAARAVRRQRRVMLILVVVTFIIGLVLGVGGSELARRLASAAASGTAERAAVWLHLNRQAS
jgi:hypothetical protein